MSNRAEVKKVCPECGHMFRGNGWNCIDAHWRARHERLMIYKQTWPLIQSGTYRRRTGSIEDFFGCLKQEHGPKLTIEEIKRITEKA